MCAEVQHRHPWRMETTWIVTCRGPRMACKIEVRGVVSYVSYIRANCFKEIVSFAETDSSREAKKCPHSTCVANRQKIGWFVSRVSAPHNHIEQLTDSENEIKNKVLHTVPIQIFMASICSVHRLRLLIRVRPASRELMVARCRQSTATSNLQTSAAYSTDPHRLAPSSEKLHHLH
jgi:hypothetical protein